ncbi:MAG: Uma2 family endonuclease [Bacteroidota bacterium]
MSVTKLSQLDMNALYTYGDYLTWDIKERLELLKGKIALMPPAPNVQHQKIVSGLQAFIGHFLIEHPCRSFVAPFDVRLPSSKKDSDTVVQPDICVICDESKLDIQGCNGAPDLVVEVLSPGNSRKEMKDKFSLYEEAGVKEYWIVHSADPSLIKYVRNEEGVFIGKQPFTDQDILTTDLFPGLEVDLSKVFS